MPAAQKGRVTVRVDADTRGLRRGMRQAKGEVRSFGDFIRNAGAGQLAVFGSVAAGVTAVGSAVTSALSTGISEAHALELSMARLEALTATTASQAERLGFALKGISSDTAVSQGDLAGALFYARSAGLSGTAATGFVEGVAQGQQVFGLGGDLIAQSAVTGAALGGGGPTGYLDALTAASDASVFNPAQFASAAPRGFSAAAAVGLGQGEYLGGLAALSQANPDANIAVTRFAQLLEGLSAPTPQGRTMLREAGVSDRDLGRAIEGGLDDIVDLLRDLPSSFDFRGAFGQGGGAAARDLRASTNIDDILQTMADGVEGSLEEAFEKIADTGAFKFDQSLNDLKSSFLEIAHTASPLIGVFAEVTKAVSLLLKVLSGFIPGFDREPAPDPRPVKPTYTGNLDPQERISLLQDRAAQAQSGMNLQQILEASFADANMGGFGVYGTYEDALVGMSTSASVFAQLEAETLAAAKQTRDYSGSMETAKLAAQGFAANLAGAAYSLIGEHRPDPAIAASELASLGVDPYMIAYGSGVGPGGLNLDPNARRPDGSENRDTATPPPSDPFWWSAGRVQPGRGVLREVAQDESDAASGVSRVDRG